MNREIEKRVSAHYQRQQLLANIDKALIEAGVDPKAPEIEGLAGVDEFHIAGKSATLEALKNMHLSAGMKVLDAGCGIGGTARTLARQHGCSVTGVDLTPTFIDVAQILTKRMGLDQACTFHCGSVLNLPFENASFDAAVCFHVVMNISDRDSFYSEIFRVLKPGTEFCSYDVTSTEKTGLPFPVPWASVPEFSFLKSGKETTQLLEKAGFEVTIAHSLKDMASKFYTDMAQKTAKEGPPPVNLSLIIDGDAKTKLANTVGSMEAGIIDPWLFIAKKPAVDAPPRN